MNKSLLDRFYEAFLLWAGADRVPDIVCMYCEARSPVVRGKVGLFFRTKYYHPVRLSPFGYVKCTFPARWVLNPHEVTDRF